MLFTKPDMKYTELCMWVDALVQKENPTEQELNKAFEYIYHIGFMLAHKHKYFNRSYYYEEFALYLATEVMHRLFFNPGLKELDENGEPRLTKIKSVLNYMKSIIYGRKVVFEQTNYNQNINKLDSNDNYLYSYNENLYKDAREIDVTLYLRSIAKTIKGIVYKNNFYKNDMVLMKNIYFSCLLTVLNGLTLTNADIEKLNSTYTSIDSKYKLLSRLYTLNRDNALILYHLDDSYKDYIKVLSNKIYKYIKDDLGELSSQTYALSDDAIMNILFVEINGEDYND